uniref:Minor capsid protein L2 n=1 Tax=Human papillomavirus 73 TaxID=51033 RepID=A0A159DSK5_HPV73|nr:L2 [human papillomavirus 73]CAD1813822.1 late protein L2 [human papillomavirus 73]CAD1813952.1 late protein L2 [human papillomavirus 73]
MRRKRDTHIRKKRASATQLYKTCKQAGTCPPDVIPKVEGSTIADNILKYGSIGVFFGGLGIGSGSGSGGRTGYVPLSTGTPSKPVEIPLQPIRPSVVTSVGPSDSSIVSLVEESSFIESGIPGPTSIVPSTSGFDITTSVNSTPAIIDVSAISDTTQISVTTFKNPTFTDPSVLQPPPPLEASGRLLFSNDTVTTHSYENIPLDTFVVTTDHNSIVSSTPIPGRQPAARLGLYGRAIQQVKVVDPAFLTTPTRLVTYDNPAFEGLQDTTLEFQHSDLHNAPDSDFLDIVKLHRPALTSRKTGIRVSRLGQRATLSTRSGKRIGAKVHFYHDISPIPTNDIEMQPLVTPQTPSIVTGSSINDGLYDVFLENDVEDTVVQQTYTPTSIHSNSLVSSDVSTATANTTIPFSTGLDTHPGPDIALPLPSTETIFTPIVPLQPAGPIYIYGSGFILHPSYYLLKRKRKRLSYSFTDVATY